MLFHHADPSITGTCRQRLRLHVGVWASQTEPWKTQIGRIHFGHHGSLEFNVQVTSLQLVHVQGQSMGKPLPVERSSAFTALLVAFRSLLGVCGDLCEK